MNMTYANVKQCFEQQYDFLKAINTLVEFEEKKPDEEKGDVTIEEMDNVKKFMNVQTQALDTIVKLLELNKDNYKKLEEEETKKRKEKEAKEKLEKTKKDEATKKEEITERDKKIKKASMDIESLFDSSF